MNETVYCGYIAIVGRPNVGKSTFLNGVLGEKISITSRKPQTTRHTVLGVLTQSPHQLIFVDTPGFQAHPKDALDRSMNRMARGAVEGVDLIVWMIDAQRWTAVDTQVGAWLAEHSEHTPVWMLINQIDRLKDKKILLPQIENWQKTYPFVQQFIPLSAKNPEDRQYCLTRLKQAMPEAPWLYEAHETTNQSLTTRMTEIIREKLMRHLGDELPYETTVRMEHMEQRGQHRAIYAIVYVAKEGQKAIVIGEGGERLKTISQEARLDIERLLQQPVYLRLWVKCQSGWRLDDRLIERWEHDR